MKRRTPVDRTLPQALREDWHLVLFLSWAVIGVCLGIFKAVSGGADATVTAQTATLNPNTVLDEGQMREVLFSVPGQQLPTAHEEKLAQVSAHRARYDANPQDPDAEAMLRAMGNLYKQTQDFQNAAWAYQQLLKRFPKSPSRTSVCVELAGCFEQLKDTDNLTRLYLGMMKDFAKDSNEYKFAEAGLKMSHLELKERDPNAKPQSGPEGTFTVITLADGSTRVVDSVPEPGPPANATAPAESAGS